MRYTAELAKFKALMNFGNKDFKTWHQEELMYLKDCTSELEAISISIAYVKELEKLQFTELVNKLSIAYQILMCFQKSVC